VRANAYVYAEEALKYGEEAVRLAMKGKDRRARACLRVALRMQAKAERVGWYDGTSPRPITED
jgi:hypothetical protein